jgi:hypothetical protein
MKKIGLLALALVLALGSLGIGFALWSETLYIEGTVNTGTLDAEWSFDGYGDSEIAEKDYSYMWYDIDGNYLYVYIVNAYPCIDYWANFDVTNTGTIPFHVCDIVCETCGFPGTVEISAIENPSRPSTPYQVHSGESAYGTITVHLTNDAVENSTYYFSCYLPVVQYNEDCSVYTPPY